MQQHALLAILSTSNILHSIEIPSSVPLATSFQHKWIGLGYAHPHIEKEA
jgi:hypothetical protein